MSRATVVTLQGELGLAEASELRENLMSAIRESGSGPLVLDLSEVTFIDATGVGVILGARSRLESEGRELRLAAVGERVLRTLTMMGLDNVLSLHPSVEQACSD